MEISAKSYRYSCRECSIRHMCIDAKNLAPGIKMTIERRFSSHTDTVETWAILQQDCLRVKEDNKERAVPIPQETSLLRRLREKRKKEGNSTTLYEPQKPEPLPQKPKPTMPLSTSFAKDGPLCGIVALATERLIRLPKVGEIVFGRSEIGFSKQPDVDLSFEDGEIPSVSRRHALLMGRDGRHWIEDMGSINGTYLNGNKLALGKNVILEPGNRILLGRCRLLYSILPAWMTDIDPNVPHACFLVATRTRYQFELPETGAVVLGRSDPSLDYTPNIDLSYAGDVGVHVSRRHAQLIMRQGRHFLEDIGSAEGTRVNGRPIRVGDAPLLLHPGDQLWLGGCVLAYEWKLL